MGNKFVMVGGGSTQSPGILEVLRKRAKELNLSDLVLYDIDEERVSLLGQYTKMYYKELGSKVNVTYTTNIDEALKLNVYGLDVSSGVETDGFKDREKIKEIVRRVRNER